MKEKENILIHRIALRVKELRQEREVSQTVMTYDTDINIGRIEAAQHGVSIHTIQKICEYFDISLAEFFKDFTEK